MNLILIPPTLGMGNSCLNELNSGFKIASICSQSEPAPVEATLRFGAHRGVGERAGFGFRDGKGPGAGRSHVQGQSQPGHWASCRPPGFLLLRL